LLFFVDTQRRVSALRWDEITEVYWKGNKIRFLRKADDKQELSVGHEGLAMNSPAVPWSIDECFVRWQDLEDTRFADGVLSIKRKGEWKRWDGGPRAQKRFANAIPNPMVYAALVKYLLENSHVEEKKEPTRSEQLLRGIDRSLVDRRWMGA
jgi:hypothetical protein